MREDKGIFKASRSLGTTVGFRKVSSCACKGFLEFHFCYEPHRAWPKPRNASAVQGISAHFYSFLGLPEPLFPLPLFISPLEEIRATKRQNKQSESMHVENQCIEKSNCTVAIFLVPLSCTTRCMLFVMHAFFSLICKSFPSLSFHFFLEKKKIVMA